MGITNKKGVKGKTKKAITKKDLIRKRVSKMQKLIEIRKKIKQARKKGTISLKTKLSQQAENQIIDFSTKNDINQPITNHQANILQLLGIGEQQQCQWQAKLSSKLQQINSKSLDNPQVRQVYSEIGRIFSTYRSGKIPKAFKIIPNLQRWKEVIALTRPQNWTPQSMYQAVNIFASNFDPIRSEQFYEEYLAPAVRSDLSKNKKLNYHYYEALKKALYKTNAWFKGILFQFASQETSLKEIKVFQSLLSKMTIPVISSAVALIKLSEMPPSSAIIHYLLALVSKHYNFPKKVITTIVSYLLKFKDEEEQAPVVWQQLFLNFVKQYGKSLDQMSKGALQQLAKKKSHKLITPQIINALSISGEDID